VIAFIASPVNYFKIIEIHVSDPAAPCGEEVAHHMGAMVL